MANLQFVRLLTTILMLFMLPSCAYRVGYGYQELPRGIKSLHIPIFKNDTYEVGPEVSFTNQLVRELKRANVAELLGENSAEGILEGRIIRITKQQRSYEEKVRGSVKNSGLVNLPDGTFVATEYLLKIKIELRLRKTGTSQIVWKQWFDDQTVYSASRLALEGINTSSPNYTGSEEERVINNLAAVMMQEAVGRLTENF